MHYRNLWLTIVLKNDLWYWQYFFFRDNNIQAALHGGHFLAWLSMGINQDTQASCEQFAR